MEEKIDQAAVAQTVADGIKYDFLDYFLVKPLEPIKVEKEFSTPNAKAVTSDKNGVEAADFEDVVKEVKKVDSDYLEGVVIKLPVSYEKQLKNADDKSMIHKINIGDTVVFRATAGMNFDLFKDSKMLRMFDILAIKK